MSLQSVSVFIILLSMLSITVNAQNNVIKLSSPYFSQGINALEYERVIKDRFSLGVELQRWKVNDFNHKEQNKTSRYLNDGGRLAAKFRWYPNRKKSVLEGFYGGLNLFAGKHNITYENSYESKQSTDFVANTDSEIGNLLLGALFSSTTVIRKGETNANVFSYGASIESGYQFFLFNFLSLSVSANYQISKASKSNLNILLDDQSNVSQSLDKNINGNRLGLACSIGVFF